MVDLRLDDVLFDALMARMGEDGYAEYGRYSGKLETIGGTAHLSAYAWIRNQPVPIGVRPVLRPDLPPNDLQHRTAGELDRP